MTTPPVSPASARGAGYIFSSSLSSSWLSSHSRSFRACTHERARLDRAARDDARHRGVRHLADAAYRPSRYLPQGQPHDEVGHHRPVDHGDAGERDHVSLDAGAGVRERNWFRAELFRAAARAHYYLRGVPADLPEARRLHLSLIHISEPTRLLSISYAVFCLKKKKVRAPRRRGCRRRARAVG